MIFYMAAKEYNNPDISIIPSVSRTVGVYTTYPKNRCISCMGVIAGLLPSKESSS